MKVVEDLYQDEKNLNFEFTRAVHPHMDLSLMMS